MILVLRFAIASAGGLAAAGASGFPPDAGGGPAERWAVRCFLPSFIPSATVYSFSCGEGEGLAGERLAIASAGGLAGAGASGFPPDAGGGAAERWAVRCFLPRFIPSATVYSFSCPGGEGEGRAGGERRGGEAEGRAAAALFFAGDSPLGDGSKRGAGGDLLGGEDDSPGNRTPTSRVLELGLGRLIGGRSRLLGECGESDDRPDDRRS